MNGSDGRTLRRLGLALGGFGGAAILLPEATTVATELVAGVALLLAGTLGALRAVATRGAFTRRGTGPLAALAMLAGAFLLVEPDYGVHALAALLVAFCLLEGLLYCSVGIGRVRRGRAAWGFGWALATGTVSLLATAAVLADWPASARWAIGLLVGLKLVATGAAMLLFARVVDAIDASVPGAVPRR